MTTIRQDRIKVQKETLYNITDTAKFEYNIKYETLPERTEDEEENIFAKCLTFALGKGSTDEHAIIIIKLTVTDTTLSIMQKDYTMLEKFKEYYE